MAIFNTVKGSAYQITTNGEATINIYNSDNIIVSTVTKKVDTPFSIFVAQDYLDIICNNPYLVTRLTNNISLGGGGGSGGTYVLPPATAAALGGVKVGEYLNVQTDGTLSVETQIGLKYETAIPADKILRSNTVYDLGAITGAVTFDFSMEWSNSVETAELWFQIDSPLVNDPTIVFPSNIVWLEGAPVITKDALKYRFVFRREANALVANLAYKYANTSA